VVQTLQHLNAFFSGGVPPEENLHGDEPGVGREAVGGLHIPGCNSVGRRHVRVELPGADGRGPAVAGHQRRGLQSGFGRGLPGDVSQRPQEGTERLLGTLFWSPSSSPSSLFSPSVHPFPGLHVEKGSRAQELDGALVRAEALLHRVLRQRGLERQERGDPAG